MKRHGLFSGIALGVVSCIALSAPANAQTQLITNGDFETGDFTGWNALTQAGSNGSLTVQSGTTGPNSGLPNVGPAGGTYFALTDQGGPGAYSLSQAITVAAGATSVILSWDQFADDWDGSPTTGPIDYTGAPVEFATADLLTGTADPFSTAPADVLANFYAGADSPLDSADPYVHYSEDITSLVSAGGTFIVRFGEADNQGNFNLGVDNVSVEETVAPEPATFLLIAPAFGALLAWKRKQTKA